MTERLNQARYRFRQDRCRCQTPQKPEVSNSTAYPRSLLEEPERSSISSRKRQHCFGVNGSSFSPPKTMKPWAAAVCGLTCPERYPHKGSVMTNGSRFHPNHYPSVRKARRSAPRWKQSTPALALGVSPTQLNVPTLWPMANYHNLAPQPCPNDWDALEIYFTELEAETPFVCHGARRSP